MVPGIVKFGILLVLLSAEMTYASAIPALSENVSVENLDSRKMQSRALIMAKARDDIVQALVNGEQDSAIRLVNEHHGCLDLKIKLTRQTFVHAACKMKCLTFLEHVLALRPDLIDERDVDGNTALHDAISELYVDAVRVLLNYNPDTALLNDENMTTYDLLCRKQRYLRSPEAKEAWSAINELFVAARIW